MRLFPNSWVDPLQFPLSRWKEQAKLRRHEIVGQDTDKKSTFRAASSQLIRVEDQLCYSNIDYPWGVKLGSLDYPSSTVFLTVLICTFANNNFRRQPTKHNNSNNLIAERIGSLPYPNGIIQWVIRSSINDDTFLDDKLKELRNIDRIAKYQATFR